MKAGIVEMEFYCPRCNKNVSVSQPPEGQQAKCPVCSVELIMSSAGSPQVTSTSSPEFIYCRECGQQNKENNFKCTRCGFVLHGQTPRYVIVEDKFIPYKNPRALWAYYLGLFSLLPGFGVFLGIAALILGIGGLRHVKLHPEARGKVHAWVGVIMGALFAPLWIFLHTLRIIEVLHGQ